MRYETYTSQASRPKPIILTRRFRSIPILYAKKTPKSKVAIYSPLSLLNSVDQYPKRGQGYQR